MINVNRETIKWLCEDENPVVRYFTLSGLLGKGEAETNVAEAKKQIMTYRPVVKILSKQNPDGSFYNEKIIDKYNLTIAKSGYQPKYVNTIWQLIFLAQLNADSNDERIQKLCKYILKTNYSDKHKAFGISYETQTGIGTILIPCFISNMVWALSKFGYYDDYRVQDSMNWLIKYQRFDDGDFKTPKIYPYKGSKDRCFGKHSCNIGCTQALKAMTIIPEKDIDENTKDFIRKAIDFILLHKVYQKSSCPGEPIKRGFEKLIFPVGFYDDILSVLESLIHFNVESNKLNDALELISGKMNENGRWGLEMTPAPALASFGRKNKENRFITYKAIKILNYYGRLQFPIDF